MQNPDGSTLGSGGSLALNFEHMKDVEADIIVFPEHKIDTTQPRYMASIRKEARRHFGSNQYRMAATSTPITLNHGKPQKPGGVLAMTVGKITGRVLATGADELGRWVFIKLRAQHGRVITVIGTYQAIDTSPRVTGPHTYVTQLYSVMVQEGREEPALIRKHHSKDLLAFVTECQSDGEKVIVTGDFNEVIGINPSGLTKLCSTCGLQDIFFEHHGEVDFATRKPGSSIIDYCLADPELVDAVTACGYESFGIRIISDHRGLFIDFSTELLLDSTDNPLAKMEHRDIMSKKAHQIVPYFAAVVKDLEAHQWMKQIENLEQKMELGIRDDHLAEKLDQRRIAACKVGGSKVKRYPPTPYSPEIAKLRNIKYLLCLVRHQFTSSKDHSAAIEIALKKVGWKEFYLPRTLEECHRRIQANNACIRTTEKEEFKSAKLRQEHQQLMIETYETTDEAKAAKRVREMQKAEMNARMWKRCAAAKGLNNEGGLSQLQIPTDPSADPKTCEEWTTLTDPKAINTSLAERNQKHFSQAKDKSLTSPPFDITNDFEATCTRAEQLLAGTFPIPEELNEATKWLLQNFKRVAAVDAVDHVLTEAEFEGKIRSWKERTSTSPKSNVHLGHGKVYFARHPLDPNSEEAQLLEQQRSYVLRGHLVLLNYALQTGYSYNRWKVIVNAMLEKEPGNPKIHRLRVIHLYEYDFNLILCVKWRKLLHHVCDHNLINWSCYGSNPGKTSLDPVFTKELEFEICRITRTAIIQFDNDATSCYDRFPCFLANIISQKYGMSHKVCMVQGKTLADAKYYLKTKLGISDEYVQHTTEMPWFGTGQGSGNSPMYCLLIMSTLYDIYESKAQGATFCSPDGQWKITLKILGFVDDASNRTNSFPENEQSTLETLYANASRDGQLWHDVLTSSNQALELSKCKYQAVSFEFEGSGKPVMTDTEQAPADLTITDAQGNPVSIGYVRNSEAIKYLGCHRAPKGQATQAHVLQVKCDAYAKVLNCSQLNRRESNAFYHAIYKSSVGYSLPVNYFTFKELTTIQSKSHRAMVAGCGYNRTTKADALYGPKYLGGAAFFHLFDIQFYGQVCFFLKFWRTPYTQQGQALRIAKHWLQFSAGTGMCIFMDTKTVMPHLEAQWFTSLRNSLSSIGGSIEVGDNGVPTRQRVNDSYIMDHVLAASKFKPATVKRINYVRMFLNVVTVSDIANAVGDEIEPFFYTGDQTLKALSTGQSKWMAVRQAKPDSKSWAAWRSACRRFTIGGQSRKLQHPLGNWIVPQDQLRRAWPCWYDPASDQLYRTANGEYSRHTRIQTDFETTPEEYTQDLPPTATPTDVIAREETLQVKHGYRGYNISTAPTMSNFILTAIEGLEEWEHSLLSELTLLATQTQIEEALKEGGLTCCDGSAPENTGSFGWSLAKRATGQRLAECAGPAFGYKCSSYRAEGYGQLSYCRFLCLMKKIHKPTEPWKCTLLCDNSSMVKRAQANTPLEKVYPNATLASEWDVIGEIWKALQELGPDHQPNIQHIKGHQDDHQEYDQMPLGAQLNVDADHLASAFLRDNPDLQYHECILLPTSNCQLHLKEGTVTFNLKRELRLARTTKPMQEHLCKRNQWTETVFRTVDWTAHGRALGRQQKHETTFVKLMNDVLPVGRIVHRYDKKYPPECPSCSDAPEETIDHLPCCHSSSRETWRKETKKTIRQQLQACNTPLPLMELFLEGLHCVLYDKPISSIRVPVGTEDIAAEQEQIGWSQILKGRLSTRWSQHQHQHLCQAGLVDSRTTGSTWATSLIDIIFKQWWKLWSSRNEDRHGRDHATLAQAASRQAIRELHQLYDAKDTTPLQYQFIFRQPLLELLRWKTPKIRAWISAYKPIIEMGYATQMETG